MISIEDSYVLKNPSHQNILDLFHGEWSCCLPPEYGLKTHPGPVPAFDDKKLHWALKHFQSIEHHRVLELGPLEGGHTYMLQQAGAARVISIEANTRAFLKCLCIKEVLQLDRVQFLLGDFNAYLNHTAESFDLVLAAGVLYHMEDPIGLLRRVAQRTQRLYLWTHFYDAAICTPAAFPHKFGDRERAESEGFSYEYARHYYGDALNWTGFCGGAAPSARWLSEDSLFAALRHLGFTRIATDHWERDHIYGPAVAICAEK